jgi:hypothetical protein
MAEDFGKIRREPRASDGPNLPNLPGGPGTPTPGKTSLFSSLLFLSYSFQPSTIKVEKGEVG